MARRVLYPAIAIVVATSAGASNTSVWRQQPLSPEVFARPFPVQDQQFSPFSIQRFSAPPAFNSMAPEVVSDSFVDGETALVPAQSPIQPSPWKQQPLNPEVSKQPLPPSQQQYVALVPARAAGGSNTTTWRQQPYTPEQFKQPFLTADQQFIAGVAEPLQQANAIVWNGGSPEVTIDGVVLDPGPVWPASPKITSATPPLPLSVAFAEPLFKKPILTRWQLYFNAPFQVYEGWVLDWPQMAKPFPTVDQQYVAQTLPPLVTVGPTTPAFVWNANFPEVALDSFVTEDSALVPATTIGVSNSLTWQYQINPEVFTASFPPWDQQFLTLAVEQVPVQFPDGWFGYQLEYRIAPPFPAPEQQFQTTVYGTIVSKFREGWRGLQFDYRFAPLFPASSQQYLTYGRGFIPTVPTPHGWEGIQLDYRFKLPLSAAQQQFQGWPPNNIPQFIPTQLPGAGKRKHLPEGAPLPPYGVKPNKPFRPVWDRGIVEPDAPIPLPPASLFAPPAPPPSGLFASRAAPPPLSLPDFKQMAPSDPLGLDAHMRDVQDQADIMAVLKSMGILKDEG